MDSFLTDSEIDLINKSSLNRDTPFMIRGVSSGMFSIARYYGGANYNGKHYTYHPPTDELIRDDVLKIVMKIRKSESKAKKKNSKTTETTHSLFGE